MLFCRHIDALAAIEVFRICVRKLLRNSFDKYPSSSRCFRAVIGSPIRARTPCGINSVGVDFRFHDQARAKRRTPGHRAKMLRSFIEPPPVRSALLFNVVSPRSRAPILRQHPLSAIRFAGPDIQPSCCPAEGNIKILIKT